jgi:CDP-diglyceride synthetase
VIIMNMYEGMVWMLMPAMLVIINDIFAYVFGRLFGKTQLIELSPKKTLEGFLGGFLSTFVMAFYVLTLQIARVLVSVVPEPDLPVPGTGVDALPTVVL